MAAPAITRSQLAAGLRELGVREGATLMVHTRMSALGWVVGAAETVVLALRDALGPAGTLMAYAGWQEHVYRDDERPAHPEAYNLEPPVFDPATSEAVDDHGRIPERIRTWPGALRSDHPEASVVALGPGAAALTAEHPLEDGYGARSPFARLVDADGQVLMLGAPLDTVTLLHHAEAIAAAAGRRMVTYRVAMLDDGRVVERELTDMDTAEGAFAYEALNLSDDPLAVMAAGALAAGIGVRGRVGEADCHLFPARGLTAFAVAWIEERFGPQAG